MMGANITKVLSSENNSSIKIWGKGEERRDLLYISDFVKAVDNSLKINEEIQPKISIPINNKKIKDIKPKKKTEQLNKTEKKKFEVTKYQAKSSFNITKFLSYILVSIISQNNLAI